LDHFQVLLQVIHHLSLAETVGDIDWTSSILELGNIKLLNGYSKSLFT